MSPTVGTLGQSRSRHAPAHAFTCSLSAICPVPTAPGAPRLQNKGEEKPQADPSIPTKPPFVQVPEEKCMRGEEGLHMHSFVQKKVYFSFSGAARKDFVCKISL